MTITNQSNESVREIFRIITGAPDHPYGGFETVTYVLEGEMEHEDSAGHRGSLRAGDVQRRTAVTGIVGLVESNAAPACRPARTVRSSA